ncbi:MAG: efflux RND transporter periplasmic adaptor subunit, partial [Candidatus Vogelbacteria bacterium]|nr:efflux RND transporter periplasmic adaptor subunit [Candidatus Vogelbacteria bacterium]
MKNLLSRLNLKDLSWEKIKKTVFAHKIISVIVLAVVLGGGYWTYGKLTDTSGETKYVISAVEKGTIVSVITGTGQVSASNQLDITSKVSGDLVYLGVKSGQKVSAGTLIAQIDARDAEASLESAQIALAKLKEPADKLSIVQAENALASAVDAKNKSYSDGFNAVDSAFIDLPSVMSGLDTLFNNYNTSTYFTQEWALTQTAKDYRQKAFASYSIALRAYNKNIIDHRNA